MKMEFFSGLKKMVNSIDRIECKTNSNIVVPQLNDFYRSLPFRPYDSYAEIRQLIPRVDDSFSVSISFKSKKR